MRSNIEGADRNRLWGWAWQEGKAPVRIRVVADGMTVGTMVADGFRDDLLAAGIANGRAGFVLTFERPLAPGVAHELRVYGDDEELPGSPLTLPGDSARPLPEGNVEGADRYRVWGWVTGDGGATHVRIDVDGETIGEALANIVRPDLAGRAGARGFALVFPVPLAPDSEYVVRVHVDGVEMPGSPIEVPSAIGITAEDLTRLRAVVRTFVSTALGQAQVDQVCAVLTAEAKAANQPPDFALGKRDIALVIDDAIPNARRDAGSQAVMSHMMSLRRLGFDIVFVRGADTIAVPDAVATLAAGGVSVLQDMLAGEALRGLRAAVALVYVHRLSNMTRWLEAIRAWCPRARVVWSVAELTHLLFARMAAYREPPADVAAIRVAELTAAAAADVVVTHSVFEADLLRREVPGATVCVVPWEVVLRPEGPAFQTRSGVAYIGSFGQPHDLDAAEVLVREIMPLVWEQDPSIPCLLAGSGMPHSMGELAGPGVVLLGRVADIASVYHRTRLTVAPLRFAAGMKGKILESMAFGVPCIASSVAVDGMEGLDGALCIADGPAATAAAILRLHRDALAAAEQARAAREWISERLGAARIDAAMGAAVAGVSTRAE